MEPTSMASVLIIIVMLFIGMSFFLWLIPIQLWIAAWTEPETVSPSSSSRTS